MTLTGDEARSSRVVKHEEGLPLKYAHYPGLYGSWVGFSNEEDSVIYMCTCFKVALKNKIILTKDRIKDNPNLSFLSFFGRGRIGFKEIFTIKDKSYEYFESNPDEIFDFLYTKDKICHQCNKVTPTKQYCSKIYGGNFKIYHGWYIEKKLYELGCMPLSYWLKNESIMPLEVQNLFEMVKKPPYPDHPEYQKQKRRIWNFAENEVRLAFDHKKIGDGWVSETILFHIIEELFPEKTLIRHYRPKTLEGLELDIYIEELNIGIEYQGLQHFKPVEHWGGEEALKKTIERDKKKKRLCNKNNINLIYVNWDEDLSKDLVKKKIDDIIK